MLHGLQSGNMTKGPQDYILKVMIIINVKKLQFNHKATPIDWHIENSKNDKEVILATITSPKHQCAAE